MTMNEKQQYVTASSPEVARDMAGKVEQGLVGACRATAAGPVTSFGEQLEKAPADGRQALARLMDRLSRDERAGERAKALRENLRALCMALPLEMPEAANRALEDLAGSHGGVR
jgi:hypothetical protein